jgi:hypothetical protein
LPLCVLEIRFDSYSLPHRGTSCAEISPAHHGDGRRPPQACCDPPGGAPPYAPPSRRRPSLHPLRLALPAAVLTTSGPPGGAPPCGRPGIVLGRLMEDVRATFSVGKELGRVQFGVTHLCTHKASGEKLASREDVQIVPLHGVMHRDIKPENFLLLSRKRTRRSRPLTLASPCSSRKVRCSGTSSASPTTSCQRCSSASTGPMPTYGAPPGITMVRKRGTEEAQMRCGREQPVKSYLKQPQGQFHPFTSKTVEND